MKIKNEEELFSLFCNKNSVYEKYQQPFLNENVWATNGKILLIINPDYLKQEYKTDSLEILIEKKECTPRAVWLEDIEKALDECTQEEITTHTTCDECDSSGSVRWIYQGSDGEQYEEDFECPVCNGSCLYKKGTGKFHAEPYSVIKIGEAYFLAEKIEKLKKAMQLLNQDKVVLTANSPQGANVFETGNAKIILAPFLYSEKSNQPINARIELYGNVGLEL